MAEVTKRCGRCREFKPLSEFQRSAGRPDGLQTWCRHCGNVARLANTNRNRDRQRVYARQWKADELKRTPDRVNARHRAWVAANGDRVKVYDRRKYAKRTASPRISYTHRQLTARLSMFGFRCWLCGVPYEAVDHVKPRVKGGPDAICNLRPICNACNAKKSGRWPFDTSRRW